MLMQPARGTNILVGDQVISTDLETAEVEALYMYCQGLARAGRPVKGIKYVRAEFGCNLRQAKAFYDEAKDTVIPTRQMELELVNG